MAEFFLNYNLMPFHFSIVSLMALSLIETIGIYLGYRPSSFFSRLMPNWLNQAPLLQVKFSRLLIVIFFLLNFSFSGYFLQLFVFSLQHTFLPPYYVIIPTLIIAIFFTVFMIHCLDQVIKPKSTQDLPNLAGRLATICSGNARPGIAAQARVRDEQGQLHYVQVEPEFGELELHTQILLIRFKKNYYIAKRVAASNDLFEHNL